MEKRKLFRLSCAQAPVKLGAVEENLDHTINLLDSEAQVGSNLVAFPELGLTGYVLDGRDDAEKLAEEIPGPSTEKLIAACRDAATATVVGLIERDGDRLFNSAVLIDGSGVIGTYRKTHLPHMGIDRFLDRGDEIAGPWTVGDLRVGLLICYDGTFPEPSRVLALRGADLVILITNWPEGECKKGAYLPACRALENVIYFAAVNRVTAERGIAFDGMSCIADPGGRILARAGQAPKILRAAIDPALARQKRRDTVPNELWVDRIGDRRPDIYGDLTEPRP